MIKYLELLLNLNEIYEKEKILDIWKNFISNKSKSLYSFSKYSYIINWFKDLLEWKINDESFVWLWDIDSTLTIKSHNWIEAFFKFYREFSIMKKSKKYKNSYICFDKSQIEYFKNYSNDKYNEIVSKIKSIDSKIFDI